MTKHLKIFLTLIFFLHHAFLCKSASLSSDLIIIKDKQEKLGFLTSPSIIKKSFQKKYKPAPSYKRNIMGGVSHEEIFQGQIVGGFFIILYSNDFSHLYNSTDLIFTRNNSPPAKI